ncbi:MAG: hypothetical protein H6Q90_307 [Deltaproteobacteria bacterium]|nr:hypothetical protein [Deltaproteobacteria bacterium]
MDPTTQDPLDLPAHVAAYPKLSVGVAFAVGALLGLRRTKRAPHDVGQERRGLGSLVSAALGALILRAMKTLVIGQVSAAAREWLAPSPGKSDRPRPMAS